MKPSLFALPSAAWLAVPFALAFVPLASGACGGVQQAVLTSDTSDAGGDASTTPSPQGDATAPITPATCNAPQDCNADPVVSSLWGDCVNHKCVCNPGMVLNASGKCTPSQEGHTLCRDLGGTCEGALGAPGDPPCKNNGIVFQSTGIQSGCNEAQHENCCIPTCNGKTLGEAGFICVRPADGCAPPVCVGGSFLDCPAGTTKSAPGGGCGG